MIDFVGTVTLLGLVILGVLIPAIVLLDRRATYRTANALAISAVVAVCVVLAGIVVLVVSDLGGRL